MSRSAGAVGQIISEGVQHAFGIGAIVVPLLFVAIGGLIIWQERFVDTPISGKNVAGTVLFAIVVLAMLEPKDGSYVPELGTGGGVVGGFVNQILVGAFGVPGTWTFLILLFLVAVLMTFNLTLYQLFTAAVQIGKTLPGALARLVFGQPAEVEELPAADRLALEPVPFAEELQKPKRPQPHERQTQEIPPLRPGADAALQQDLVLTPIAARPTQPGLFDRRRDRQAPQVDGGAAPAEKGTPGSEAQRVEAPAPAAVKPARDGKQPKEASPPPEEEMAQIDIGRPRQAWPLPSSDLLEDYVESEVDDNEKLTKARIIEDTLASFKIEAQVLHISPGPAVTQYQLQPAVGVKVSRITSLDKDLALALAAPSIRIEAPIPGTSYIGVEIPNTAVSSVSLKEVIESDEFSGFRGRLKIAIGKDVSGRPIMTDLTRAPHLLIAGSTGSGKSAAINSIVATLLMQHTPDDLKFMMIDPKMVELIVYNHIPHLLAPVVTELERVVSLLKWAVREMERRYKLLANKGFRNIDSYNKEAQRRADLEPLPYIVIIVDELADLMMLAPDEVETLICRLAQMARAIGIHLILATQRPSVDVVTGLIKANFPTRMAFAVTQQIDSRVILDVNGAEQLLGKGDMLYLASDAAKPIRVQGTWVSDREIEKIANFWRATERPDQGEEKQAARPPLPLRPAAPDEAAPSRALSQQPPALPTGTGGTSEDGAGAPDEIAGGAFLPLPSSSVGTLSTDEQDELLPKAIALVRQHERASASLLQRRLRIGYSKAAQLIDLLEQQGIVGPAEGGRSREVLYEDGL